MKKKTISFILTAVLLLFLFSNNVSAASRITLAVAPVKQAKSYWCWAASCEMVGVWAHPYPSSKITQWGVVKYLYGNSSTPYPDVPGSLNDSKKGSEYVTENEKTFDYTRQPYRRTYGRNKWRTY